MTNYAVGHDDKENQNAGSMNVTVKDEADFGTQRSSSFYELSRQNSRYDHAKRWGTTSHFWNKPADSPSPESIEELDRKWFILKVYSILSLQLAITIGIGAMCMYIDTLREGLLKYKTPLYWTFFALLFLKLFLLFAYKDLQPVNFFIMIGFTLVMSFFVGIIVAHTYENSEGGGFLILYSLAMTIGIFIGLTGLMWLYKPNLYWMHSWLFTALWALILWGLSIWILRAIGFDVSILYLMYCLIGIILFCGYICYDTSAIIHNFGPEDAIIASIELYLDIINLFLFILGAGGGDSD